jgi:hypothetical protein
VKRREGRNAGDVCEASPAHEQRSRRVIRPAGFTSRDMTCASEAMLCGIIPIIRKRDRVSLLGWREAERFPERGLAGQCPVATARRPDAGAHRAAVRQARRRDDAAGAGAAAAFTGIHAAIRGFTPRVHATTRGTAAGALGVGVGRRAVTLVGGALSMGRRTRVYRHELAACTYEVLRRRRAPPAPGVRRDSSHSWGWGNCR